MKKNWLNIFTIKQDKPETGVLLVYLILLMNFWLGDINVLYRTYYNLNPVPNFPKTFFFLEYLVSPSFIIALIVLSLFLPFYIFLNYQKRSARIIGFFLFILVKAVVSSYTRTVHGNWPFIWTLMFFQFIQGFSGSEDRDRHWLKMSYRGALLSATLFYAHAGFWKLFNGLSSGRIFESDFAISTVSGYLVSHGKPTILGVFFVENELLTYFLVLGLIAFQLSAPLSILSKRYFYVFPILLLLFHITTFFVLQVNYFFPCLITLLLFIYAPQDVVVKPWAQSKK